MLSEKIRSITEITRDVFSMVLDRPRYLAPFDPNLSLEQTSSLSERDQIINGLAYELHSKTGQDPKKHKTEINSHANFIFGQRPDLH